MHPAGTEFGRKTQIHQPSCNKDCSCLKGNCPSFVTVIPGEQTPRYAAVAELDSADLPDPVIRVPTEEFGMRITGIGLLGSDQVANTMLVGAAYQSGALPLTADSIEQAIELNGVAVAMNLQAFRRGRQAVSDPEGLQAALSSVAGTGTPTEPVLSEAAREVASIVRSEPGSQLEHPVNVRVSDLIGYQSAAYAERHARAAERGRAAEAERAPGHSELAEAAAFGLYKLMAYKDEYEVARLHLENAFADDLRARCGADASFRFMLHPPMLKALGMQKKIKVLGRPGLAMFEALASMKLLRGTRLDPFGRDHVRVVERELIREFDELLNEIVDRLTAGDHGVAVDLARLPDMVRGYDEVKLRNVDLHHEQMGRLRAQLSNGRLRGEPLRILR